MNKRFWDVMQAAGNITAIFSFVILVGFVVVVYGLVTTDDAELFPAPLVYIDPLVNTRGNTYYLPVNGDEVTDEAGELKGKAFCLGETVRWGANARTVRSTRIQPNYYLQVERPYRFVGPGKEALEAEFSGPKRTSEALYMESRPSTYLSEGFFAGGARSFRLPEPGQLRPHSGLEGGDALRLYVEVEAPFSQTAGYYVPIIYGADCPVIPPTDPDGLLGSVHIGGVE